MAKNLIILVGPPGSGKTTLAKEYRDKSYVYINQDSQGKDHLTYFEGALDLRADIVVDRMGFNKAQRARYILPAIGRGYKVEIIVLHEPYAVCLARCLARKDHETITEEKHARSALATFFGKYERPTPDEAEVVTFVYPKGRKPSAIICDLDGTLCNVEHRLHFVRGGRKDWKGFFEGIPGDRANGWCSDILSRLGDEHEIVYCSGRPDNYRDATVKWLKDNHLFYTEDPYNVLTTRRYLYMRPRNDSRDDSIVKEIILDFEILTRFTPYFMIDDRKRVFEMWRRRGFITLACANGDF